MAVDTELLVPVGKTDDRPAVDRPVTDRPATSLMDVFRLRPGWPLVLLFLGFPIWWALGITELITFVAACAMAYELVRMRTIRVPPGFGWWLLFLAWIVLGVVLVQIDVPGAVASASSNKYVTWAWRMLVYLKATIVLLYIGNMRRRLSLTWVCRVFGWMFVVIVAGGLLGVLAPTFQFHSLAELVLPKGFTSNAFVYSKVHPVAAEIHVGFLDNGGRTSAPFPYANVWGLNFACFLPFFVIAWFGRDAGWRRFVGPFILAIAGIPVIFSLNRGLWAALLAAAVFTAVRSALAGRGRALGALLVGAFVVGAALVFSPLGHTVDDRLHGNGPSSNEGRDNLSSLGLSSMAETSPIVGLGTTRSVQGNFNSIAGGSTTLCPRCSLPPLGTQGQFSLVTFTQGIVGAVLYFGFLALQFLRYVRMKSGYAIAAMAVLLMHFITSAVYSADNLAILAIFGSLALAWRASVEGDQRAPSDRAYADGESTIRGYLRMIGDHRKLLAAMALAGVLGGALLSLSEGRTYAASVSIDVPADPVYAVPRQPTTLDTIAQYATSTSTLEAMQRAAGLGHPMNADTVVVTATPNTTILHLKYSAGSENLARAVVSAAAQAVLAQHSAELQTRKNDMISMLQTRLGALSVAIDTATTAGRATQFASPLTSLTTRLEAQARQTNAEIAQAQQAPLNPGTMTASISVRTVLDRWKVNLISGLGIGLLVGVGGCVLIGARGPRLRSNRYRRSSAELPIVAAGAADGIDAMTILTLENPTACIAASARPAVLQKAAELDSLISSDARARGPGRVIVVADPDDRPRSIERARHALAGSGVEVVGIVLVGRSATRPRTT